VAMDRLGSLSTFVQAAELRNFTSAGRRLGISSSAVGKTIARLEERLGVRLFVRSTRSVTLTAEGATFLERCRRIFAEIEAAEAEMAQSSGVPTGRLRVSLPLTGMLLTPVISDFAATYPKIELDIDFSDRLVDIVEEGFDVVLRTGVTTDSALMTRVLGSYSYAVVASPDYLARAGTPHEPEDLLGHVCLHHRWSTTGKLEGWRLKRDGEYLQLELPVGLVSSTIEPLIEMAERGLGITAMPVFAVRRQLEEGRLVSILDSHLDDVGTFRMMWPAGRQGLPRVRAFVDYMGEHLFAVGRRQE
jgi:DNA-binding transcriptional LysR family regulator